MGMATVEEARPPARTSAGDLAFGTGWTTPSHVIHSFTSRAYKCPWWAKNPHASTILGSGEVQKLFSLAGEPVVQAPYRRERWDTPDGDFVDVDFLDPPGGEDTARDDVPTAILTHGLESTSTAPLTTRMALAFQRQGFRVAVMCFRGCSGEDNLTMGAYHLGFTDDLHLLVETLRARHPSSPLFLSGFSLGGNIICKYLGEQGEGAVRMGIMGAAVACVPFHARSCQSVLDSGFGKAVYSKNFLNALLPKAKRKAERHPRLAQIVDMDRLMKSTTMGEFDDQFIAAVYGFDGGQDYYRKNEAGPWLKHVRVPLLAVQARDDPFMDENELPKDWDLEGAPVKTAYYQYGGHCSFITSNAAENRRGWLATELARFGGHASQLMRQQQQRRRQSHGTGMAAGERAGQHGGRSGRGEEDSEASVVEAAPGPVVGGEVEEEDVLDLLASLGDP